MKNGVWIVLDSSVETGAESIKGIFQTEERAKIFLADYVIDNDIETDFLSISNHIVHE